MPRPVRAEALTDAFVWRLSVTYIGNNSRTERPRKTKIGAHVTHDSDTTFKVKRSKIKVTRPVYSLRRLSTGSSSGQRGNELSMGNWCYVGVCRRSSRLGSARRYGAHTERRGAGAYRVAMQWHAHRLLSFVKLKKPCGANQIFIGENMLLWQFSSSVGHSSALWRYSWILFYFIYWFHYQMLSVK